MVVLKIFLIGFSILIGAIIINMIAGFLKLTSWYDFLNKLGESGVKETIENTSIFSYVFLFIVYPLLLGLVAYTSTKFLFKF